MKRKVLPLILSIAMVAGVFAGCSNKQSNDTSAKDNTKTETTQGAKAKQGGIFGLSVMTLGVEFFTNLQKSTEKVFGDAGYKVTTASCEMDVAKQVTDIENLVTQGAKGILVGPMDPGSLQDAAIKARKAGTSIITFGAFKDKEAYDVLIGVDEKQLGAACASIASEWVDKTFASAANGSIDTILVTAPGNDVAKLRIDGLKTIADNKKVKIVQNYELGSSDTPDRVQEFIEMALSQHPNFKAVICQDASFAIAANEVLAKTKGIDKSKIGVFAIGTSESALKAIKASATNDSMIRGLINLEDVAESAMKAWQAIQEKKVPESKFIAGSYFKVNVDNVDKYLNK